MNEKRYTSDFVDVRQRLSDLMDDRADSKESIGRIRAHIRQLQYEIRGIQYELHETERLTIKTLVESHLEEFIKVDYAKVEKFLEEEYGRPAKSCKNRKKGKIAV